MVELVELIVGAVLIGGAAYVVYREFGGGGQKKMACPYAAMRTRYGPNYGIVPLPENVESWISARPAEGDTLY